MTQTIRIGGVPEHFNLPWQLAAERDVFSSEKINFAWTVYAGGTGAMTKALMAGELDVAILLTEGFLAAKSAGLNAQIAKVYIDSPLVWGIYTGFESARNTIEGNFNSVHAISRFGSGSHLMAMVNANQHGVQLRDQNFKVVNSLHYAIESLNKGETDVFYWEKFMTRPYIKDNKAKIIGEFSAPWSSFLIVASNEFVSAKAELLKKTLQIMNEECITFKQDNASAVHLSKRFDMTLAEARKWLTDTHWNYDFQVQKSSLENAMNALSSIGMCDQTMKIEDCCAPWLKMV